MSKLAILTDEELETILKRTLKIGVLEILEKLQNEKKARPTYTRAEASREIGVSKATIGNMIDKGTIKTTADGKFIPRHEILRYLNK